MSSNSDMIRVTVWLPNSVYKEMHEVSEENAEPHAVFIRRAITKELKILRMEADNLFRKLARANNGRDAAKA